MEPREPDVGSQDPVANDDDVSVEFIDLIGHSLRSPLTNICVIAELLLDSDLDDDSRAQIGVIRDEAMRLGRMIEGALGISRAHHGRPDLQRQPIDLGVLCESVARRMALAYPDRAWEVDAAPDLPRALADADRTENVLHNLLDNAAKYSPRGTPVHLFVAADRASGTVRCTVADHGKGIPSDDSIAVFERYRRLDPDAGRRAHGYGLGLYIARRLVELQGGRIWVESAADGGARFSFELPVAEADA